MADEGLPPWALGPAPGDMLDAQGYVRPAWTISDDNAAEWAMERVRLAQLELDRLHEQYQLWRQRLDDWLADNGQEARAAVEFFTGHLERYAIAQREAGGPATVKLPGGKIATRKASRAVIVADEEALLASDLEWLGEVLAEPRVLVSKLRDHVRIVDVKVGDRYTWECGHWYVPAPPDHGVDYGMDEAVAGCAVCGLVGSFTVTDELEPRVMTLDDGEVIPGLEVRPENVTAVVSIVRPALAEPVQPVLESGPQADMDGGDDGGG